MAGTTLAIGSCYSFCMEVTVRISDELAAQAEARGLRPEAYVEELLARQFSPVPGPLELLPLMRTPEEIRSWLDSLAQFSDKIPPLPDTISRDWLYQDHD